MSGLAHRADSFGSATGKLLKSLGFALHLSCLLAPCHTTFTVLVGSIKLVACCHLQGFEPALAVSACVPHYQLESSTCYKMCAQSS